MAILEGLGPTRKIFDDLPAGDYLFEIAEPGEKGWIYNWVSDEDSALTMDYVNWRFRVIQPEEFENKPFFYSTMVAASPEKIAQAKKPYDPAGFTYQFLGAIGAGVINSGMITILDNYLTNGEPDLDKLIGLRFWGSVREEKDRKDSSKTRMVLTKAWAE